MSSQNCGCPCLIAVSKLPLVEAVNQKDEEYGEAALLRLVDRESESTPAELLRTLLAELDRYVGNTSQHDDITCLLLKRV